MQGLEDTIARLQEELGRKDSEIALVRERAEQEVEKKVLQRESSMREELELELKRQGWAVEAVQAVQTNPEQPVQTNTLQNTLHNTRSSSSSPSARETEKRYPGVCTSTHTRERHRERVAGERVVRKGIQTLSTNRYRNTIRKTGSLGKARLCKNW